MIRSYVNTYILDTNGFDGTLIHFVPADGGEKRGKVECSKWPNRLEFDRFNLT